jgi:hypothetical protein
MGTRPGSVSGSGAARAGRGRLLGDLALITFAVLLALSGFALARMQSTKLGPRLCETVGGGRFVDIPGFPGERIDRRLLTDVRWLEKRYRIFVTDGYSTSDVHAANGEHPLGLALDIVPNKAAGGRWSHIDRLAAWAEPRPDRPRQPFRWVGYDGDANHGRGHHLHLSWSHSPARPARPARTVYSLRCPSAVPGTPVPAPEPPEPPAGGTEIGVPPKGGGGGNGGGGGGHGGHGGGHGGHGGGQHDGPGSGGIGGGDHGAGSGGVGAKQRLAPPVAEAGGISAAG